MRRFFIEYCETTGETTIGLGDQRMVFSREEWDRNQHYFGKSVFVTEVRPWFALFGTRTQIRWVEAGTFARK